jgi:hypothetical protein
VSSGKQVQLRSSAARRSTPPRKYNATAQAVEGNLGGFCVYQNGPGPVRVPRSVVSELPAGRGMGANRPAEVLALGYG